MARGLGCRGRAGWPARPGARCRGRKAARCAGRTEACRLPSHQAEADTRSQPTRSGLRDQSSRSAGRRGRHCRDCRLRGRAAWAQRCPAQAGTAHRPDRRLTCALFRAVHNPPLPDPLRRFTPQACRVAPVPDPAFPAQCGRQRCALPCSRRARRRLAGTPGPTRRPAPLAFPPAWRAGPGR